MNLTPIPVRNYQASHPKSPFIRDRSWASNDPQLWLNQLRRTNTIAECEAIKRNTEAERYAEQWELAA